MFHHFGLKLLFWGQKFDIFGGKYGSNVKIKYFNPQKAHPCVIPRILSYHASKSLRVPQKKINKKSQECDISPICPEVPHERIFTKLGTNVPLVDVVSCDKLCDNLFKGLNFTGGQTSKFSRRNLSLTSPLTVLRYGTACILQGRSPHFTRFSVSSLHRQKFSKTTCQLYSKGGRTILIGKGRRHDGRKGEEGRDGELGWGICATAARELDATGNLLDYSISHIRNNSSLSSILCLSVYSVFCKYVFY